jgi:DNA-binding Xre family transcriptional regulator
MQLHKLLDPSEQDNMRVLVTEVCIEKNIPLKEVARQAGISESSIKRFMLNRKRCSHSVMIGIAHFLACHKRA